MRDKLIPEEKIMAIQEQFSGFIVEQVLDPKGEFYYVIKNEYTYANMMEYVCIIYISTPIIYMCIYIYLYNIGPRHFHM